jgi:L-lysine 2,3-aminomutase
MDALAPDTRTLRTPDDLAVAGFVADAETLKPVAARYAIAVTPAMAALIRRSHHSPEANTDLILSLSKDAPASTEPPPGALPATTLRQAQGEGLSDPIARQFIPTPAELTTLPNELADPIGDEAHSPVEGVVHRYPDRLLLKIVHACPVYCRFCFRREMVGPGGKALTGAKLDAALAYVAAHSEVREVILTGGDPFILTARRAGEITRRLAAIPHVKVIRWHTRGRSSIPAA